MNDQKDGRDLQGVDPKGQVFAGLAAVIYAAESPISGSYIDQSMASAMHADAAVGGLRGRRVLDVGCGFGTTTMAIARHAPSQIISMDTSEAHLELYRLVLMGNDNIDAYLRAKEAPEVLGDLYDKTLKHFEAMRAEFQKGVFRRNGGSLRVVQKSSLDMTLVDCAGPVDVVVGNNFLHWPVNQRRAHLVKEGLADREAYLRAVDDALRPLAEVLRPNGIAVILEPKDFVTVDDDHRFDDDLESVTMVAHPVHVKMQEMLNALLRERYGIERAVPKTTALFRTSELGALFAKSGLVLTRIAFYESTVAGNPVDSFFVRLPMWLGSVTELGFEQKIALGKEVRERLPATLKAEEAALPIRGERFIFIARKAE